MRDRRKVLGLTGDDARNAILGAVSGVHQLTVNRHAAELKKAAITAELLKPGEEWESHYDENDRHLHFGPYAIPGKVIMGGVPATIAFMLSAKAQVDIARQLADLANVTLPKQDAIYAEARPSLEPSAVVVEEQSAANKLVWFEPKNTLHPEAAPDVYGASYQSEDGVRRMSDWIQTFTGKKFHVLEPQEDDFDIRDIAHALSLMNRYTGHTRVAYSVAEHSVRVMWCVQGIIMDEIEKATGPDRLWEPAAVEHLHRTMLAALLHDASEAYLNDIARPIKMIPEMQFYRDLEKGLEVVVARKWGLTFPWPRVVKRADEILLVTEKRDLMGPSPSDWVIRESPLKETIFPWSAEKAERTFLNEYRILMDRLGLVA